MISEGIKYAALVTYTMCLNKEIVPLNFHTQIAIESCFLVKSCCDVSWKKEMLLPARF